MAKPSLDNAAEIARLEGLAKDTLSEEWRRLHQTPPPKRLSRELILRGITYRLQENEFGGLSKSALRKQFNTTTSMGRLTLNMLLSFAQFEREIAGERIRDKIAASKAKGMWMGGTVPLGYDVKDRKLIVNVAEAKLVRHIFARYAELGSVTLLQAELDAQGHRSKRREGASGRLAGDRPFSRGILYLTLQNRLYRGEIAHKGNVYPGQHEAIIDQELWTTVQDKLAANRRSRSLAVGAKEPSLLAGLIFDSDGTRMIPTHANKRGRRFRYYVSASLLGRGTIGSNRMRVPAGDIDRLVLDQIRQLLASPQKLAVAMAPMDLSSTKLDQVLKIAKALASQRSQMSSESHRELVRTIIIRVTLSDAEITIGISIASLARALALNIAQSPDHETTLDMTVPAKLRRTGKGKRMIIGEAKADTVDPSLVRLLQEANAIRNVVLAGTNETLNEITARRKKSKGYLTSLMRLSYLAPSIIDDILNGRQPPELSAKQLLRNSNRLPLEWASQRTHLCFV